MKLSLEDIPNIPQIKKGDDLGEIICAEIFNGNLDLKDGDIICVASKIVSIAEGRRIDFTNITPNDLALEIHKQVPRKDARIIQLMLNEINDSNGEKMDIKQNYIGCWLQNGLKLTSAGIDRVSKTEVVLLPKNPDISAKAIGEQIYRRFRVKVGVVITDSDGREDKKGSTQIAIGIYGVPALRKSNTVDIITGKQKTNSETLCDLIAAGAALIMGQRGTNKPVVKLSGLDYIFDETSTIKDSL